MHLNEVEQQLNILEETKCWNKFEAKEELID